MSEAITNSGTEGTAPPARAFFIAGDGTHLPDHLVCSGAIPAELGGRACPNAEQGRIPVPIQLDSASERYSADKGAHGDLCPPCAWQQLGPLSHWQGHGGLDAAESLRPLRLFKCARGFWLVVPGLRDDSPQRLTNEAGA